MFYGAYSKRYFKDEKQLQNYIVQFLCSRNIWCKAEATTPGGYRADVLLKDCVIEVKLYLTREHIYQARGQAEHYRDIFKVPNIHVIGLTPRTRTAARQALKMQREMQTSSFWITFIDKDPSWGLVDSIINNYNVTSTFTQLSFLRTDLTVKSIIKDIQHNISDNSGTLIRNQPDSLRENTQERHLSSASSHSQPSNNDSAQGLEDQDNVKESNVNLSPSILARSPIESPTTTNSVRLRRKALLLLVIAASILSVGLSSYWILILGSKLIFSPKQVELSSSSSLKQTMENFFQCINRKDFPCSYALVSPQFGSFQEHKDYWQRWRNIQIERMKWDSKQYKVYVSWKGQFDGENKESSMVFWLAPLNDGKHWKIMQAQYVQF